VQPLGQQVQHLTQLLAQQAARTPEPQGQGSQSQSPQFNLQVPPQYLEAIGSDDPVLRAQALNGLLNGVAQTVHAQTIKDVETRLQTLTPQVQRQVQEAQSQAEIKRDMYGTYPELNGMQDMVVAAASQLQAQFPGGWSQDYRDAIAERLAPLVPGLSQRVQQNRAQRGQVYNQPQYAQYGQQVLPQVQQPQGLPAGVSPQQIQGGVHVQAGNPQPILVRDAQGNISQVYPQHQQQVAGGAQSRPNGAGVDPALQDIWSTLGFA
ncbi:MAG: hypothetical protein ACWGQW_07600, partial [bacterium]